MEKITFDIKSSRDMLEKLTWEITRLKDPKSDRASRVYCAINCAWTGWHMHEWVWADMKQDRVLRSRLATAAGEQPQFFDKQLFGAWIAKQENSIEVCRQVTTAAKHVGYEPGEQTIETTVSASRGVALTNDDVPEVDQLLDWDSGHYIDWIPKLIVDDKRVPAFQLFEQAHGFWTHFVYSNKIAA